MSTHSHTVESRVDIKSFLQGLDRTYRFENPYEFRSLVKYHPDIADKLREAVDPLEACFGDGVELSVQVRKEWEGPLLWVFVCGEWSHEDANQKLQQFNDVWGLNAWSETNGMFNVDVRFR